MDKILGYYKFKFGEIEQIKSLISHDDYLSDIKPLIHKVQAIENMADGCKKDERDKKVGLLQEKTKIETYIKEMYGESWFTDKSPYFHAITSGFIPPLFKGAKDLPCFVERVDFK